MITKGVRYLLDFIYKTETGKTGLAAFNTIYGHNEAKLAKPLTQMTLDEVIKAGPSWTKRFKSSAAGAAQFMNATLKDLKKQMGLSGDEVFSGSLQDDLAYQLLVRRGYHDFIGGRISRSEFGKRLAMEWASFPVLAAVKGAHRTVQRGETYYAGDALNKALVAPEKVETLLDQVKRTEATPKPAPEKEIVVADPGELSTKPSKSKTVWTWALTAAGSIVTAIGTALGGLDWKVQMFICVAIVGFAIYGIKRRNDLYKEVKGLMND